MLWTALSLAFWIIFYRSVVVEDKGLFPLESPFLCLGDLPWEDVYMKHQELRDAAMIQGLGGSEVPMFPHVGVLSTGYGQYRKLPQFFKKKLRNCCTLGNVAHQDVINFKMISRCTISKYCKLKWLRVGVSLRCEPGAESFVSVFWEVEPC